MSLVFPHHPATAAQSNLNKLLSYNTSENRGDEHLTTEVGLEALDCLQKANLGLCHQVKKYTASIGAYTATLGVPVAAVAGGTYYLLKDYIETPSKAAELLCPLAPSLLNSTLSGGCTSPEVEGYFSGKNLLLGLAALGGADYVIQKGTGFTPLRSMVSWTGHMLSTALLYAAYKAGEMATHSYDRQEKEADALKVQSRKTLFEQTKAAFDVAADGLMARAEEVKDNPKEILLLKEKVARLARKMDAIRQDLASDLRLEKTEVAHVLDKLQSTIRFIEDISLSFRSAVSESDHKFNIELMSILSSGEFSGKELSLEVQNLLEEIEAHTFGFGHVVKSYVAPVAQGAAYASIVLLPTAALMYAATQYPETEVFSSFAPHVSQMKGCVTQLMQGGACEEGSSQKTYAAIAGTALAAIACGGVAMSTANQHYLQEAIDAEELIARNKGRINEKLAQLYSGMALYLDSQPVTPALKLQAERIREKIPQINQALSKIEVLDNPELLTGALKKVVDRIVSR